MAPLARVVVPGLPHHVTQRGNRCEPVFFRDDDYRGYLDLIAAARRGPKPRGSAEAQTDLFPTVSP
jgi:REP element-mobilizing transposase RayT